MRDAPRKRVCMHALRPAFCCGCRKRRPIGCRSRIGRGPLLLQGDHFITAWRPCLSLMTTMMLDLCAKHFAPRCTSTWASSHLCVHVRRSTLVLPCDSISSPSPTNPCLAIRRTRRVDPQSQSRVPAMSPSRFVAVLYVFSCASREQLHRGLGIVRARLVCFWIALTRSSRYSLSSITPAAYSPLIIITCYSVTLTLNEPRRGPGIRPLAGTKTVETHPRPYAFLVSSCLPFPLSLPLPLTSAN
ncbi:hypothetical protein BKA56DRAFT_120421 [Ilyonectria sp. MPI-CAGE-AT-0026]|nr:hypothetical protein BKA56DRAFT_120421 [Ilyonectria sp. MPI-CAGE-AT-0026]